MGKNENLRLLLFYFDERFLEMFDEWSSAKHILFVQTSRFDWLPLQPKGEFAENNSEAIWELQKCS